MKEIVVDGVTYIRKSEEPETKYVIVRTDRASTFAGFVKEKNGLEITLVNARRIWYWEGAASLSQLAMEGTSKPEKCKFPCEVGEVTLPWIEIITCTEHARNSIRGVAIWKA